MAAPMHKDDGKRQATEGIINVAKPGSVVVRPPKGMKVATGGGGKNPPRQGG